MLLLSLLLAQAAISPQQQQQTFDPAALPDRDTLIVEGINPQRSAEKLDRCLARGCPPAQDIALSMSHADNQLIAGDLRGARKTLSQARDRNKRHAEQLPTQVSGLIQFDAEVASLLGLPNPGRIGTIDSLDALKEGLPADSPELAAQRLRIGDVFLNQNRFFTAVKMFDAVAKEAAKSGWPEIEGAARMRSLYFYATAATVRPAFSRESRKRYAALRATTDPRMRDARDASYVLEARLKLLTDKRAKPDEVIASLKNVRSKNAILVSAPPIEFRRPTNGLETGPMPFSASRNEWVDVAFMVARDGKVSNVETIEQSSDAADWWVKNVRTSVAERRYLPLDIPVTSAGLAHKERFMIVTDTVAPNTGSRIRTPGGSAKLVTIDLMRQPS